MSAGWPIAGLIDASMIRRMSESPKPSAVSSTTGKDGREYFPRRRMEEFGGTYRRRDESLEEQGVGASFQIQEQACPACVVFQFCPHGRLRKPKENQR